MIHDLGGKLIAGSALLDELARVYAWTLYDEENWVEMCVVPRDALIPVTHERKVPVWGN